jgi:hypothetical protein
MKLAQKISRQWGLALLACSLVVVVFGAASADLSPWFTFSSGDVIRASEVNQNFATIDAAITNSRPKMLSTGIGSRFQAATAVTPTATLEVEGVLNLTQLLDGKYLRLETASTVVAVTCLQADFQHFHPLAGQTEVASGHAHPLDGAIANVSQQSAIVAHRFHLVYDYTDAGPDPETDIFTLALYETASGGVPISAGDGLEPHGLRDVRWKVTKWKD